MKASVKCMETESFYGKKKVALNQSETSLTTFFFGMQLFMHSFLQQEEYHILHKQHGIQEEIKNITFCLKNRQKCYIKIMKTSCKITLLFV